jgi:hypothetical protein
MLDEDLYYHSSTTSSSSGWMVCMIICIVAIFLAAKVNKLKLLLLLLLLLVGIVRSRTKGHGVCFVCLFFVIIRAAGPSWWQHHRHPWADCLYNVELSKSHDPMGFHGLLRGWFYFYALLSYEGTFVMELYFTCARCLISSPLASIKLPVATDRSADGRLVTHPTVLLVEPRSLHHRNGGLSEYCVTDISLVHIEQKYTFWRVSIAMLQPKRKRESLDIRKMLLEGEMRRRARLTT